MKYPPPPAGELARFMEALASVESGGRYNARNATSGARGRYQIMPANWPGWARRYLGDAAADPWLPANQDRVARGKLSDLYRWLGRWDRVAAWWLAGGTELATGDPARWPASVKSYVSSVLTRFGAATPPPAEPVAAPVAAADAPAGSGPAGCARLIGAAALVAAFALAELAALTWAMP